MLSTAFSIAGSGLRAMQSVVDTGSANIANANTPGYRRRDAALSELVNGGVASTTLHRFNESTAARLAQLSGDVAYQDTLAKALGRNQEQLSEASSQLAQAFDSLREAIGTMTLAPGNAQAREVAVGKAAALTSTANAHLRELDQQAAHLGREQASTLQAAQSVLAQMQELNRAVMRHGPLPELRDSLAQRAVEFAQLAGGELRFNLNGTAVVSIRGQAVLDGDVLGELPPTLGGQAGALAQARVSTLADRDAVVATLDAFAARVNEANRRGVDANGQAGGDLFAVDASGLRFVGTAASLAVSDTPGLDAQNIDSFLELGNPGIDLGAIAVRSAQASASAQGLAGAHGSVLQSLQERQRREEGVDLDAEAVRVKEAQRLYEANAKLIQVADAMLGALLSIKA